MDYIATQINEVMIELGYQFVSSKVLRRKNGSDTTAPSTRRTRRRESVSIRMKAARL